MRCVDADDLFGALTVGKEYRIRRLGALVEVSERLDHWYLSSRFKPVVRVPCRTERVPATPHIFAQAAQ